MTRRFEDHELVYWSQCSGQIRPRLRRVLLERDGDACACCFKPFGDTTPDIDHIIPGYKPGWSGQQWNLRLVCRRCNSSLDQQPLADRYIAAREARHRIGDYRSDEQVAVDELAAFRVIWRSRRKGRRVA